MKSIVLVTAALLGASLLSAPASMAADLTDEYAPYVLSHEIQAVPGSSMTAHLRLADRHDPYVMVDEIHVAKGCESPVHKQLSDTYNPFVTAGDLIQTGSTRPC